ncbi:unnamed protein product [Clonostachys rosea]|uniref:Uncharacterized protein n=1 Tax=Bionectria ochroleuca TaxID=29856 RepID=A0ABY6TSR7_BIOOC|nr:unnamed protein product [Clonostachys rosea]
MHISSALAVVLAAAGFGASGPVYSKNNVARYPVCPWGYETYCCMTVAPYSTSCRGVKCTSGPGWSCILGPGKVESMQYCMNEVGGNKNPYCKKPGYENFGTILKWEGSSFTPMLKPSDYRQYLRPGMNTPWVPSEDQIRWEGEKKKEEELESELRKREPDLDETDLA